MTTAPHTVAPQLPPGFTSGNLISAPRPTYTLPTPRGVNHLLGLVNATVHYGDREIAAELLDRHTVGSPPFGDAGPRRVSVGGETAVIGHQHPTPYPWARWLVRFDWLQTYPSFYTLVRALEDPRFRPGAVEDFGGGRFEQVQSWWATPRYDDYGDWICERDVSIVRLLFIPTGGGVAIDIGSVTFDPDPDTEGCPEGDALLNGYGFTPEDVEGPREDYECVLGTEGVHVLEELFG